MISMELLLLMEEILHQLIWKMHYFHGFIPPRWCIYLPSTVPHFTFARENLISTVSVCDQLGHLMVLGSWPFFRGLKSCNSRPKTCKTYLDPPVQGVPNGW